MGPTRSFRRFPGSGLTCWGDGDGFLHLQPFKCSDGGEGKELLRKEMEKDKNGDQKTQVAEPALVFRYNPFRFQYVVVCPSSSILGGTCSSNN